MTPQEYREAVKSFTDNLKEQILSECTINVGDKIRITCGERVVEGIVNKRVVYHQEGFPVYFIIREDGIEDFNMFEDDKVKVIS